MKRFELTLEHLWSLAVLVGVFVFVSTHPIRPQDFWWHMAVGRETVETGQIPGSDIYSYTMSGQPYPSYQMFWLMEVALYGIYRVGGAALVVFVHSLVITTAYWLVTWTGRLVTGSWRLAAFGALFAAALGLNDWNVRPQAVTFLLGALFLWVIVRYRQQPGWGWLAVFPFGMLVWVNSHGTFPLGLGLVGLWLADEAWQAVLARRLRREPPAWHRLYAPLWAMGLALAACLVNPRGLGILDYLKTLTGNAVVQNLVPEWAPPTFNTLGGTLFLGGLLLSAALLALSPRRPTFFQLAAFLVFAALGLKTGRGMIWFGLVMGPILAEQLGALAAQFGWQPAAAQRVTGSARLNQIFALALLGMAFIALPWFKASLPLPPAKAGLVSMETPVDATRVLLDIGLPTPLFHAMSFGSYLIWAAQPEYQVFVDGRIELFSLQVWQDYLAISGAQADWQARLDAYGVQTLLLSPTEQEALVRVVEVAPGWQLVYKDETAYLFTRVNP